MAGHEWCETAVGWVGLDAVAREVRCECGWNAECLSEWDAEILWDLHKEDVKHDVDG